MNAVTRAIAAGAAGAGTTTILHQLTRRLTPDAPRVDLLGMQALARLLRAGGAAPPTGRALYNWTLAGDLASNSAYFGAVGAAPRERAVTLGRARSSCRPPGPERGDDGAHGRDRSAHRGPVHCGRPRRRRGLPGAPRLGARRAAGGADRGRGLPGCGRPGVARPRAAIARRGGSAA